MTRDQFLSDCRSLCALRPDVYRMQDLTFWTAEQLSEALAEVAMADDKLCEQPATECRARCAGSHRRAGNASPQQRVPAALISR